MNPSSSRGQATRLFVGGLIGWHFGLVLAAIIGALIGAVSGFVSGLLGAGLALFFYAVGQVVQIVFAEAPVRMLRTASITSYVVRVTLLGVLLYATIASPELLSGLDVRGLFVGIVLGVLGWLTGLVITHHNLRIPIYDLPLSGDDPPSKDC